MLIDRLLLAAAKRLDAMFPNARTAELEEQLAMAKRDIQCLVAMANKHVGQLQDERDARLAMTALLDRALVAIPDVMVATQLRADRGAVIDALHAKLLAARGISKA